MSDEPQETGEEPTGGPADAQPTRRRLLALGAASASAVVTIRPALAQSAGSVLACEIPVPDPKFAGKWIAPDGKMVPASTPGAFAPPARALTGEEVRAALSGSTLPGVDYEASRAYINYVRRLQGGMSGFTCYQSLQMPRA